MAKWLAMLAIVPVVLTTAAHAQIKGLAIADVAGVARSHELDLRLRQQQGVDRPALLVSGMLAQQELAPNANIGLGLANMYGRRKGSAALRPGDAPARSRKPAVTFVVKF